MLLDGVDFATPTRPTSASGSRRSTGNGDVRGHRAGQLRYGNWNASEDQIWQAARDANAEEFLRELPEGLDTFMGEGGARLWAVGVSASPLPAPCCATPPYYCSTKRRPRSTPRASGWSRTRSTG